MDIPRNSQEESSLEAQKNRFEATCVGYIQELRKFQAEWETLMTANPEFLDVDFLASLNKYDDSNPLIILIYPWIHEFADALKKFNSSASSNLDIFILTPWKHSAYFSHNIGAAQFGGFWAHFNRHILGRESDEKKLILNFKSMVDFIEQLICHLQAAISFIKGFQNIEDDEKKSSVIKALQVALRSRLFFGDLKIPGISDSEIDGPKAMILGDAAIESSIPFAEIVELAYVPISNAHRIMMKEPNPGNLKLETSFREIVFEGQRLLVLEFFNTGKLVDLTKLQQEIVKLDEGNICVPELLRVVQAIKRGSRQAHLEVLENALVLDGLTLTTGGTGMGLHDLHQQLELRGGAVLLNNVYAPEEGFCTTIILPQERSIDPNPLKSKLATLKRLLQSGQFFLEKVSAAESVANG